MDAKITKKRLSRMLSYDWLKIVGMAAALILVWVLIFTMTATKIMPSQQFTVFNYTGNLSLSSTKFYNGYEKAFKDGVFSYEVIETNENDLTIGKEYTGTLLETRLTTDEGDVILVADIDNPDSAYEDENGNTLYEYSYLETFVYGYSYYLFNLDFEAEDSYFGQMRAYLNRYYDGDYKNGELNEETVESDFRARAKQTKDKRYKKEKQIQKGVANDILRIQKYQTALVEFEKYLADGVVTLTRTTIEDPDNAEKPLIDGVYSINLCPNEATMGTLSEQFAYRTTYTDENGATQYTTSALNMNIAFFNLKGTADGFEYESLLYCNHLIRTYYQAA